jgi:hypothetical protein
MASLRDLRNIEALKSDATTYNEWLNKNTAQKQAAYNASKLGTRVKPQTDIIRINMFNSDTIIYQTISIASAGTIPIQAEAFGMIGNFIIKNTDTIPGGYALETFTKGRKFAQLRLTEALESGSRTRNSRITGRVYKQRPSSSITAKFGQGKSVTISQEAGKTATTTETAVTNFSDAKKLIGEKAIDWAKGAVGTGYRGYRIIPEG